MWLNIFPNQNVLGKKSRWFLRRNGSERSDRYYNLSKSHRRSEQSQVNSPSLATLLTLSIHVTSSGSRKRLNTQSVDGRNKEYNNK